MTVSDVTLAGRVALGDVAAFRELYARHAGEVYVLAAHIVDTHAAEEVVQDVFVVLWRRAAQFDPERGSLAAWLMAITRNRALDELARARRRPEPEAVDELFAAASEECVEESTLRRERQTAVLRALRELPSEQRLVLVLGYFGGLSQAEIAHRLGLPLGTVKKRVRLGMQKLRASLATHGAVEMDESKTIAR